MVVYMNNIDSFCSKSEQCNIFLNHVILQLICPCSQWSKHSGAMCSRVWPT